MEETFDDGLEAFQNQEYDRAIEIFENCIQEGDNIERSNYNLGQCYFSKKDFQKAQFYLQKAVEAEPENFEYLYSFGMLLIQVKNYVKAYPYIQKVVELNGNSMEGYRGLATCYLGLRRYSDAKAAIINAIYFNDSDRGDNSPDKLCHIVYLLSLNELGLYRETLDAITEKELLEYYEDDIVFIREKLRAHCELEEYDECIELANQYADENNEFEYFVAKCLFKQKKYKEAEAELNKVIKEKPNIANKCENSRLYILKAQIDEKLLKSDPDIMDNYRICIKNNPDCIDAYIALTQMFLNYMNYEEAFKILEDGKKHIDDKLQKPYELLYLLLRIECFCGLKRRAEANEMLVYVRNTIRDENIRQSYTKKNMIEIFSRYFEVYHLCKFLYSNYLKIDRDSILGKGGFGKVYRGTLKKKQVAVKEFFFKDSFGSDIKYTFNSLECVFMEISAMELLSEKCKNILGIEAIFYENNRGNLMLITPLMKGGNLLDLIKDKNKELSVRERINILYQIALAIRHIQSFNPPFIHHDIKSANVLLEEEYNEKGNKVKLCDFGMVETKNKGGKGFTPSYAAPEFMRNEPYSCPIDIFSYGVVCWECFARTIPFKGKKVDEIIDDVCSGGRENLDSLKNDCPSLIKEIISKCFEEEPNSRPTISEIIQQLENYLKNNH